MVENGGEVGKPHTPSQNRDALNWALWHRAWGSSTELSQLSEVPIE